VKAGGTEPRLHFPRTSGVIPTCATHDCWLGWHCRQCCSARTTHAQAFFQQILPDDVNKYTWFGG
jgi:hypothetical protein